MRGFILAILLLVVGVCQAQSVQVKEVEQEVLGVKRRGQQLSVQLDTKTVERSWKDYLGQKAGRVRVTKGVITVEEAKIDTISDVPVRLLSLVSSDAMGSNVWWTLDFGTDYLSKSATPKEYTAAEKFMRGFARKLYREDVFRQINAAEDVLQATKAEQDRVVKEANSLQLSIERNKQRRKELEQELVRNAEDLKQLEQEVQLNRQKQELSRQRVQEMEQSVDAVRAKLLQVNR
ncbi:DNA repair ATPase [Pontibacter anaerobius]|uniref:DNA repair ATPase n=1 Tax=Pontibacter anaerobius TaxID=2993940 RepID=A0ABT3RA10_9BACT|nr:DNA repair ATPase [Pontibacter anaerobius]MCX2738686.1 DNA repair ATPase [Pontibacter anaerobius]